MSEADGLRMALREVWERTPNKAALARTLGVTRQEIYKYVEGSVVPRAARRQAMLVVLKRLSGKRSIDREVSGTVAISAEKAFRMRQLIVELLDLLDLDEGVRGGTLGKDG